MDTHNSQLITNNYFFLDLVLFLQYNNNMAIEMNNKYSWDPNKRDLNIKKRGLDFVLLADLVFSADDLAISEDRRQDYGENRFNAHGTVMGISVCLCFTPREDKKHLITIFRTHKKQ